MSRFYLFSQKENGRLKEEIFVNKTVSMNVEQDKLRERLLARLKSRMVSRE